MEKTNQDPSVNNTSIVMNMNINNQKVWKTLVQEIGIGKFEP
jgi:hypothetical protein